MKKQHPRFLGFLWLHHKFERRKDLSCTKKCIHCEKEKHSPQGGNVEVIEKQHTIHIVECRCRICGMVWHSFLLNSQSVDAI